MYQMLVETDKASSAPSHREDDSGHMADPFGGETSGMMGAIVATCAMSSILGGACLGTREPEGDAHDAKKTKICSVSSDRLGSALFGNNSQHLNLCRWLR